MLPVYDRKQRVWMAAFILTLTLTANAESSEFEVFTSNVTVTDGDEATLICNFIDEDKDAIITSVYWKKGLDAGLHTYMPPHGANYEAINIMKGRGHFKYQNTNGSGTTNLTIFKALTSDAGQYFCSIDIFGESGKTKELYLTVDPRPTTTTTAKPRPEKPKKREQERDPKDKNRPSSLSLAEKGPAASASLTKATMILAVVSVFLSLYTL